MNWRKIDIDTTEIKLATLDKYSQEYSKEKLFNELEKISTKKNEQYIYLVYSMYMDCMWWNIINYEFKDKK